MRAWMNLPEVGKEIWWRDDIISHSERLQTIDAGLAQRIRNLVCDIDVDLDAALPADDE